MIKTKKAGDILNCITLKKDIEDFQGKDDCSEIPLEDFKILLAGKNVSLKTKLILNSTGLSDYNTLIRKCIHLLEIALYLSKNKGCFIIGEQGTGKSTLFTHFLKNLGEKTSGALTTALLIGNANINDESKIKNSDAFFNKKFVIVEEFVDESSINDSSVIGTLKNGMESGTFLKCKKNSTKTETTIAFIGNSYREIHRTGDLLQLKKDLPQSYQDRGLHDRIPFLLPHFHSLFGETKYVESYSEVIPIQYLQQILQELRDISNDKIYITSDMGINPGREFNIYNSFITSIYKLFYYNEEAPKWFIYGWLEFLKFFRSILIDEKIHNPFNKNSARFILEMLDYSIEEIDYVTFDNDRILIKFENKNILHKVALTGFAIENNKKEYSSYNKNKIIAPILNKSDDYLLLIQKINGELPFESRIYFNNIKKYNAEKIDKEDKEFNILILEEIEKYARLEKKFNEDKLKFRGVPYFYKKIILEILKEEFDFEKEINLNDFCFDSDRITVINFSKYIKKDIYYN